MLSSRRLGIAAVLVAAGLAVLPAHSSSADSGAATYNRQVHFYLTHDGYRSAGTFSNAASLPLRYYGGPTMHAGSTTYSIFWQPTGTYMSPTYKTLINRYFNDVGGSTLYGVAAQYYDYNFSAHTVNQIANSSAFGGTWTDTSSYPSSVLSDAQIQGEVAKAITANGWTPTLNSEFFVYLAKGENDCDGLQCSFSTFCGYHGITKANGTYATYAAMPYAGTFPAGCGFQEVTFKSSPNGDVDADSEINITSHEHMEAVTDPIAINSPVNIPYYNAWVDANGYEIGDKCAFYFGPVALDGGNITMNGHRYIVQEEWSNSVNNCAI